MDTPTGAGEDLLAHVLVPVADEDDARATCRILRRYGPERVTAVNVVEKGEGVPDKTPVEQSEAVAEAAFAAVREAFPEAATETAYDRDVVEAILETAADVGASAVAFRPREGGRLVRLISGDRTLKLVTEADRPVVALQAERGEDASRDR